MRKLMFDLQLFATGTVQNYVRNGFTATRVAVADLTIANPQGSLATSNPSFTSNLGVIYAGDMVYLTTNNALASLSSADPYVNTTGSVISATGSQVNTPVSMTNIKVGSSLLIDTLGSGHQETVTVTAVTGTTFTAVYTQTHLVNAPIVNAKANSNVATFVGVAVDTYPIVWTQGVSAAFPAGTPQKVQYRRDGEYRFHTTTGDTLVIGQLVYLGADAQTVQATALGTSIGRVASDQRPVGVQLGTAVTGAAGQDVIIAINVAE